MDVSLIQNLIIGVTALSVFITITLFAFVKFEKNFMSF